MLVLSRREAEKVVFPTLGIAVEVLRVQGNKARLGIDAPPDIPILRHEIARRNLVELTPEESQTRQQLSDLAHVVRRRLDSAATALNQLHRELETTAGSSGMQEIVTHLYHDLEALEQEANRAIEWTSAAKALHVLVVEDSATERKLLAGLLELSGLNVSTAHDGRDALDFLSLHASPDAVLLDMMMPRCDGPQFVREVRSNPDFVWGAFTRASAL